MGDEVTAVPAPRVRVSAAQSAKGLWQVDATVETFDGADPVPMLASKIGEVEAALRAGGHKLASDAA